MLFTNNVPRRFWGDDVLTAAFWINRIPSRVLNFKTPIHSLLEFYPNGHLITDIPLKVFGCSIFVHIHSHNRSKLDTRSQKCIFLGYSPTQKGYKCYSPFTRKFYTYMDVTFLENEPFYPASAVQVEQISNEPLNLELFFEPQILEPSDSQIHHSSNHIPSFDHVYSRRRPLQLTDLQNTVHN